jgi:hypothetical protein
VTDHDELLVKGRLIADFLISIKQRADAEVVLDLMTALRAALAARPEPLMLQIDADGVFDPATGGEIELMVYGWWHRSERCNHFAYQRGGECGVDDDGWFPLYRAAAGSATSTGVQQYADDFVNAGRYDELAGSPAPTLGEAEREADVIRDTGA